MTITNSAMSTHRCRYLTRARIAKGRIPPITIDNRRVLIQEWLAESCTMWGMAALLVAVTATAADTQAIATVHRTVAGLLMSLAVLTALTGARTPIVWFKVRWW